tara:strand:- start:552 stop:872 length:321 start_codon:yes stop_codon:yes gene_type:complete
MVVKRRFVCGVTHGGEVLALEDLRDGNGRAEQLGENEKALLADSFGRVVSTRRGGLRIDMETLAVERLTEQLAVLDGSRTLHAARGTSLAAAVAEFCRAGFDILEL